MTSKLKKELKEDFWKIINREEIQEKDENLFISFIFYMFLRKNSFTMDDVINLGKKLKQEYENALDEAEKIAVQEGPLKGIVKIYEEFKQRIIPIIREIDEDEY